MRALLVMGPTASGKSTLALAVAERLDGEIVNADSMQVYRDLQVLTARPTPEDLARAPHQLYGYVDAAERFSVGRWLADALLAIESIRARGRTPIIAGGTGLYFRALTHGLAEIPAADEETRVRLLARAREQGAPALHAALAEVDAEAAARLSPNDEPRILRALEVFETTGLTIGALQAETKPPLKRDEWAGLALTPDRAQLYAAIDARFEAMLAAGALDEVRTLASRKLDPMLPAMKAHGAPALMAHLRGEISLAEATALGQRDTRRYAKRQFTWIGNQMPDWPKTAAQALDDRVATALALLA